MIEGINAQGLLGKPTVYRIPAPEPVGPQVPAPPAFKVGDNIKVVGSCNYEHNGEKSFRGQTGKITDVDLPDKHSTYLARLSGGSALWFPASSLKLLPPEPQMYICPTFQRGDCKDRTCPNSRKHTKNPNCEFRTSNCPACIPVEAKAEPKELTLPTIYCGDKLILPSGEVVAIPMTRKRAQELGIIRGKSAIRQAEKK